jgi:hypothetical protein
LVLKLVGTPEVIVCDAIDPEPPFALKVTVFVLAVQRAYKVRGEAIVTV